MREGSREEIHRELVHALERARSRLAVVVATERRATPLHRWKHYWETEERLRRCLKQLRSEGLLGPPGDMGWSEALELLRRLPKDPDHVVARHGEAQQLCRRLGEILLPLEQHVERKAFHSNDSTS